MKTKILFLLVSLLAFGQEALPFCGFYVARADAKLFNKSSQVILVRDGSRTVITMANDFEGDVKDFAMVVPVPVVLKKNDIKTVDPTIFQTLDDYSAPRMAEYHDPDPCQQVWHVNELAGVSLSAFTNASFNVALSDTYDYGVTIEAKYEVGEYDILILSATESNGLKRWLTDNDYKIPGNAHEVLDPYIKDNLKFFVVKVNLDKAPKAPYDELSPIQISFESSKFMLPIRLGMANANGDQDMLVYAFTRTGRIETTNYRTVKIPTDRDVPVFVQSRFGKFYKDLFDRSWVREGKNAVFLEYAWDLNSSNYVKCDPCASTPPQFADLKKAGVFWLSGQGSNYQGNLHFTRLHVRYNREKFPQDLRFQLTPNKENFQGRYVIRHPAKGDMTCEQAHPYLVKLVDRRERELGELAALTGWDTYKDRWYVDQYARQLEAQEDERKEFPPFAIWPWATGGGLLLLALAALLSMRALRFSWRPQVAPVKS